MNFTIRKRVVQAILLIEAASIALAGLAIGHADDAPGAGLIGLTIGAALTAAAWRAGWRAG